MALWGNKDNVGSTGTVSLNYSTRTVTGTATSFGIAGGCSVGDVIRFGIKNIAGTYFGDASIIAIASSESLTIGSTMGLSGVAIAGTDFQVSQLPKSTILDVSYSKDPQFNDEAPSFKVIQSANIQAPNGVSAGSSILPTFSTYLIPPDGQLKVGDLYVDGATKNIPILTFGTATIAADNLSPVGFKTVFFDTTLVPAIGSEFSKLNINQQVSLGVVSVAATSVTIDTALAESVGVGSIITVVDPYVVALGATITNAKVQGALLEFGRYHGGYDKYAYGIGTTAITNANETAQYGVAHAGWVGVTTYIDNAGELRVKSEVLVAGSGIHTGNQPLYPPT